MQGALPIVPSQANLRFTQRAAAPSLAVRPALMNRPFAGRPAVAFARTPFSEQQASVSRATRVAFGSDHAGFTLKELLKAELAGQGHDIVDLGTFDCTTSVDYPDFGAAVGRAVAEGQADLGV